MRALLVIGCVGWAAMGCDGDVAGGDGCRSSSECASGEGCVAPVRPGDAPPLCGMGCSVSTECASDDDCAGELLCLAYLGPCCGQDGQLSTACKPACADDAVCGEGYRCKAVGRGCEPVPCDEGFACPAHTVCDPAAAEGRAPCEVPGLCGSRHELDHGCVRRACASDGGCAAGGVCVEGTCQEGLGTCEGPRP